MNFEIRDYTRDGIIFQLIESLVTAFALEFELFRTFLGDNRYIIKEKLVVGDKNKSLVLKNLGYICIALKSHEHFSSTADSNVIHRV